MALTKPVLNNISPFDANVSQTFHFTYQTKNYTDIKYYTYNVYNASNLRLVSSGTYNPYESNPLLVITSNYDFSFPFPANICSNGSNARYYIELSVTEGTAGSSPFSDKKYFNCYTYPEIGCSIANEATINTSVISPVYTYSQADGESLQSYTINLLDDNKSIIKSSGTLYDINNITYTFRNITGTINSQDYHTGYYYVQFVGNTVNGMTCVHNTHFYIYYPEPQSYGRLQAENELYDGYVKVYTNIVIIRQDGDEVYSFEDGKWVVIPKGHKFSYSTGYAINNNFALLTRAKNLYTGDNSGTVFYLRNKENGNSIKLTYYIYENTVVRFKLTVTGIEDNYILYSDPITLANFKTKVFNLRIKRINNIYQLSVKY